MPRKKTADPAPATTVSAIRKKAAALKAGEKTADARTAAAKPRVAGASKRKITATRSPAAGPASGPAAGNASLFHLNGAVNGHANGGHVNGVLTTAEQVAQRAYYLWLERGCPQGMDEQNWIDAERELGVP
jgi:hypothetical protein